MSLPVEHFLRIWAGRKSTATEKRLATAKIDEIDNLISLLRELAPGTLIETVADSGNVSFVVASTGKQIATLTVQDDFLYPDTATSGHEKSMEP